MILTGYRARFTGVPYGKERWEQERQLAITTRGKQYFLAGAASFEDRDSYCVIENMDDNGYDYIYCYNLDKWTREHLYDRAVMGVDFVESLGLEFIHIPAQMYAIFETKDLKDPTGDYAALLDGRVKLFTEWMPDLGFQLSRAPEIAVYHWNPRQERHIEIWMPIEKKEI